VRPYDLPQSILVRALELDPGRRAAFLDDECAGDPELRAEVEQLLVRDDARVAALAARAAALAEERPPEAPALRRLPWRGWLAFASGAALVGFALSSLRTPPTPSDWIEGLLRPRTLIARATADLDSVDVRLRTATVPRARAKEAVAYAWHATALLRTVNWRREAAGAIRAAHARLGAAEDALAGRVRAGRRAEADHGAPPDTL
jgi:hypothetical protein